MAKAFFVLRIRVDGILEFHKFQNSYDATAKAYDVFHDGTGDPVDLRSTDGRIIIDARDMADRIARHIPASPNPGPNPRPMSVAEEKPLKALNDFMGGDAFSLREWRNLPREDRTYWGSIAADIRTPHKEPTP